jgi:hypothetical protein
MPLEKGFVKGGHVFLRRNSGNLEDALADDDPFDFAAIPIHPRSKSFQEKRSNITKLPDKAIEV